MDIRKLQRAIVDGLEDVKAQDIVVYNTEHLSPMFERVIVASGTSNRQTKALAASVRDSVKSKGLPVLSTEGEDNGEWIIVDCGAAVAHIMQPAIRDYYHLEEIWGGKPVRMKVGAAAPGLPKASEPAAAAAPRAAAKKVAAGKAAAPAPAARQVAAKKGVAKKVAAKKGVAQTVKAKKVPATTVAAKKVTAKRPAAKASRASNSTKAAAGPARARRNA
ncbi:MAG: ribosome silencing factor [Rubrivivax sp.]|nr:ribosome silencing factor [Rubrivivax sp.]